MEFIKPVILFSLIAAGCQHRTDTQNYSSKNSPSNSPGEPLLQLLHKPLPEYLSLKGAIENRNDLALVLFHNILGENQGQKVKREDACISLDSSVQRRSAYRHLHDSLQDSFSIHSSHFLSGMIITVNDFEDASSFLKVKLEPQGDSTTDPLPEYEAIVPFCDIQHNTKDKASIMIGMNPKRLDKVYDFREVMDSDDNDFNKNLGYQALYYIMKSNSVMSPEKLCIKQKIGRSRWEDTYDIHRIFYDLDGTKGFLNGMTFTANNGRLDESYVNLKLQPRGNQSQQKEVVTEVPRCKEPATTDGQNLQLIFSIREALIASLPFKDFLSDLKSSNNDHALKSFYNNLAKNASISEDIICFKQKTGRKDYEAKYDIHRIFDNMESSSGFLKGMIFTANDGSTNQDDINLKLEPRDPDERHHLKPVVADISRCK